MTRDTANDPPAALTLAWSAREWGTPVHLGGSVNSAFSERQVGISPDGQSLYVSSDRPGTLGGQDLWVSHLTPDGDWSPLTNLGPAVNSPATEESPTLSVDGHYLYFASQRPGGLGGLDCWRSYRKNLTDDLGWESPGNLGPPINSSADEADCLPHQGSDGREAIWFASFNRPGGAGDWDMFRSEIGADGSFGPVIPLAEINTPFREARMTLSADGRELIFASNRPGGFGGIDLWMARRAQPQHPFCPPRNLGPSVNSRGNDRSPSSPTGGTALYFTSTRGGGHEGEDVYAIARRTHVGPGNAGDEHPCPRVADRDRQRE